MNRRDFLKFTASVPLVVYAGVGVASHIPAINPGNIRWVVEDFDYGFQVCVGGEIMINGTKYRNAVRMIKPDSKEQLEKDIAYAKKLITNFFIEKQPHIY